MTTTTTDTIRVLHVDDEPEFTELVATFLEREDDRIDVRTATSPDDGRALLSDTDIDCVVSDYDMPQTNGIAFLEAVREEYPELPFILYTGKGSEEVASEAISAGVTDYLQKGSGTDQYTVLTNRIMNAVESYWSKQALAERNRELRRYKYMVNSMQEAACIYDPDGRFVIVNEYLADWYNTSREALEGEQSNLIPSIRAQAEDGDPYQALLDGQREQVSGEVASGFPGHGDAVLEYQLTPLMVDGSVEGVVGVARDVTERRARENELHRNKRAMDEAPVGITITDPGRDDNPVIYANRGFLELTGYQESAVLGRNCRFLQGAETDHEQVAAMRDAIDNTRRVTVELRNYREDGTEFWNRVSIAPVRDDGEVVNYVGFQQDITERKEREQELNRIERRYQAVFNDPNILVGLIDTDGTVLDINQTAMEYVDATVDEVMGSPFWETPWFDHSDDVQRAVGEWVDRAASGEYVEFEADLVRPDGEPYTIEGVFRPVTNDDGEVVSLLISDRDITERKAREQELERHEAYLEESNDIITVLDDTGTISYESPAVGRILGYEPGSLVGTNGFELIHPDDVDEVSARFTDLLAEPGATVTVECRFRTADGEWRWLEVRGTNQLDNDAINGVVTNNRDITERKAREQELERTNALLSTLVGTLPVGVLAEDGSRTVLTANERLFELLEMPGSPEEAVGTDCERLAEEVSDLFVDPEAFVERTDELVRERESVREEVLSLRDGRTFARTHEPIELPDGEGHLWVYRDITEHRV